MTDEPGRAGRSSACPRPARRAAAAGRAVHRAAPSRAHRRLTPERAARIVRQSASARWVGFLARHLRQPVRDRLLLLRARRAGRPSTPRLDAEVDAQQVTVVERGYNLFEANCARCHGANGRGRHRAAIAQRPGRSSSPTSTRQYIRNVLTVGGRYVCGNANSLMPVWADTGNGARPLNYLQIEDADRVPPGDEARHVPRSGRLDRTSRSSTRRRARSRRSTAGAIPNYKPAPGATPYPDCWLDAFATPARRAGRRVPGASGRRPRRRSIPNAPP